jgi:predicted NAD/FAD-binding protein
MTVHEAMSTATGGARSAVVIGGGLAGTTAALTLADAGLRVTLTEARPRLGGLAFSFKRGELTVDNGQHVFLRCCTAYQWFLDRIAARDLVTLQDRLDVPVLEADTLRLGRLHRTALPVPLHLAAGLLRYPHLSLRERASVGRAALALGRLDLDDPALDRTDFASWLRARGQSARTIEALWDLVGVATLNARSADASLGLAAKVFKTGLLRRRGRRHRLGLGPAGRPARRPGRKGPGGRGRPHDAALPRRRHQGGGRRRLADHRRDRARPR